MDNVSRALLVAGGGAVSTDPLRNYVTLLLKSEGPANSNNNTFIDSSTNAFTITRSGNTTQGSFSPFGSRWSNYFDGSIDQLVAPDNAAFAFGTGDFTVEAWAYPTAAANQTILANMASSGDGDAAFWIYITANGAVVISTWFTTLASSANGVVLTNAWNHIAVSRSGSTAGVWVNGTRVLNPLLTTNFSRTTGYRVGAYTNAGTPTSVFTGYIADVRVVKGTAVYNPANATITVPTDPLTAISGTSLLTCQSNRFVDNSVNNFAITRIGDVSVQRFSPFSPGAPYAAGAIGGSGYFDGNGDFLTLPDNVALEPGNSDLTWEMWINTGATAQYTTLYSREPSAYASGMWALQVNQSAASSGNVALYMWDFNGGANTPILSSSGASVCDNAWHHIAVVRSGSAWTLYIDGVSRSTNTWSGSVADIAGSPAVGYSAAFGRNYTGYISNFRVTKGTAVYTANFTPPTAPVTAIANTSLLLNFTNAGVFDDAMISNLETVGSTQISTTGGGSMAFNGTTDWLVLPPTNNLGTVLGTGDFTIEFWVRYSSLRNFITNIASTRGANGFNCGTQALGQIVWFANGAERVRGTTSMSTNTWHHVAFVRSGGILRGYLNGVQDGTTFADSINYSTPIIRIGDLDSGGELFPGFMDDVRITKAARYLSNFTRPTDLPSI